MRSQLCATKATPRRPQLPVWPYMVMLLWGLSVGQGRIQISPTLFVPSRRHLFSFFTEQYFLSVFSRVSELITDPSPCFWSTNVFPVPTERLCWTLLNLPSACWRECVLHFVQHLWGPSAWSSENEHKHSTELHFYTWEMSAPPLISWRSAPHSNRN